MLLICRRWKSAGPKPPTRVVNLARNPATPLEALDTAARIERAGETHGQVSHDFTIQLVDSVRIERGDWFAVNFLSPYLVEAHRILSEAEPGAVPMVPMSDLAEVGPAGQRIRDAYTHADMPTQSGRRALWYHKTDVTQSMGAQTDVYIERRKSQNATLPTATGSSAARCYCRTGFGCLWRGSPPSCCLNKPSARSGRPAAPTTLT